MSEANVELPDDPAPELDPEDYELDPEAADLPELSEADLPDRNPADPDDDDFEQDDFSPVEGLGAGQEGPVWRRAVRRAIDKCRRKASNEVGYCLREIRLINEVDPLHASAKEALYATRVRHRITDWSKVPRGAIVYFDAPSSKYGHITESFGGGPIGTTDYPRGRWGRIHGATLMKAWGYTVAYWSPEVNGVTVWAPVRRKPAAPSTEGLRPRIAEAIVLLAKARLVARRQFPEDVAPISRAIRALLSTRG